MVVRFEDSFLAVDWGTTNRRIFRFEGGAVVGSERDDCGVKSMQGRDYAGEADRMRARFGDLPMLLAGMVGSNIGWQMAPYVPAPAGAAELAAALLFLDERTAIVPGIAVQQPADVMRGEEVQLIGAVAAKMVPGYALLVQPGTHCKWAEVRGGRIAAFRTAMTGELFAMLVQGSLLGPQLAAPVRADEAFVAGLAEGRKRDLPTSLFSIRARGLLGQLRDADAASFASGLLIGSDVAARLADYHHDTVHIIADPDLGGLYAAAVEAHHRRAVVVDTYAAFAAGILEIGKLA